MRALVSSLMVGCFVAAMIFVCGCDDPQWLIDIHNGFDRTRKECRPADVRIAVMPLIEKYGHTQPGTEIPGSELPEKLYSLPLFLGAARGEILGFVSSRDELIFMVGSGFGHWGIMVCKDKTSQIAKGVDVHKFKLWGDGIFFYSDYK